MNWNQIKDTWKRFISTEKEKRVLEKSSGNKSGDGTRRKTIKEVMNASQ